MSRFPPIKYRIISDEFGDERFDAYLIDEENAIEITEYGVLDIIGVTRTEEPGVYLHNTGTISLGNTEDEADIASVIDRLRNMTAYELIVRFMVRSSQPFNFNIVDMKVVDPGGVLDEP